MFLSLANSWRWSWPWGWDQERSFWHRLPLHMAQILPQSRELSARELGLGGRGPRRRGMVRGRPPDQPHSGSRGRSGTERSRGKEARAGRGKVSLQSGEGSRRGAPGRRVGPQDVGSGHCLCPCPDGSREECAGPVHGQECWGLVPTRPGCAPSPAALHFSCPQRPGLK